MSNFIKFKDNQPDVINDTWQKMLDEVCCSYFLPSEKRKVCVDIGSNIGAFMGYALSEDKFEKVYGFEPAFQTYHTSLSMLKHFNLLREDVQVRNLAVTDQSGQLLRLFGHQSNESGNTSLIQPTEPGDHHEETCLSVSLDGIFDLVRTDYIDYLKMDCEGAEVNILFGSRRIKDVGIICMEIHHGLTKQINEFLTANGFWTLGFQSRQTGETSNLLFAMNTEKEDLNSIRSFYGIDERGERKTIGDLEKERVDDGGEGLKLEEFCGSYKSHNKGEEE
jgi:FkbM family methyltransferase